MDTICIARVTFRGRWVRLYLNLRWLSPADGIDNLLYGPQVR